MIKKVKKKTSNNTNSIDGLLAKIDSIGNKFDKPFLLGKNTVRNNEYYKVIGILNVHTCTYA